MFRSQHFSTLLFSLLLSLLAFLPTSNAWQFSQTNVELSSPPPTNSGDSLVNGERLANYSTSITGWPCYNYPVPPDVARTPFPIYGGRLSFNLTNTSASPLVDYQYTGDAYLGQISLGNGTYSTASVGPDVYGYYYMDTYAWYDFSTGPECSDPINMVEMVARALHEDAGELRAADLVGMNATIGLRIVLFGPNPLVPYKQLGDQTLEEMYQCGYIYFTEEDLSNDPNAGYCNGGPSPTGSSASDPTTLVTSTVPTPTSPVSIPHGSPPVSPVPTPGNFTGATASGSHTNTLAVGTGVGVSMGASLLILIIAFIFIRRRKARKHSETIGADIMVTRLQDVDKANDGKGEKGIVKEDVLASSADSTHSEQLPPYTSAREVPKEGSESDVTWNASGV